MLSWLASLAMHYDPFRGLKRDHFAGTMQISTGDRFSLRTLPWPKQNGRLSGPHFEANHISLCSATPAARTAANRRSTRSPVKAPELPNSAYQSMPDNRMRQRRHAAVSYCRDFLDHSGKRTRARPKLTAISGESATWMPSALRRAAICTVPIDLRHFGEFYDMSERICGFRPSRPLTISLPRCSCTHFRSDARGLTLGPLLAK